jgi:hypothetical protein
MPEKEFVRTSCNQDDKIEFLSKKTVIRGILAVFVILGLGSVFIYIFFLVANIYGKIILFLLMLVSYILISIYKKENDIVERIKKDKKGNNGTSLHNFNKS